MKNLQRKIADRSAKIGLIGLGYVGLPLAVEFGKHFDTVGFDVKQSRLDSLRRGEDPTLETSPAELASAVKLKYSSDPEDLRGRDIFIVTVPTPVDRYKHPDLNPLYRACETIDQAHGKSKVTISDPVPVRR